MPSGINWLASDMMETYKSQEHPNSMNLPPSVVRPVSPAISRMKRLLFRPFDFSKWLAIGFCSWLAGLGGSTGGNFNFNRTHQQLPRDIGHELIRLKIYLLDHLAWVIPVAALVLALLLALVLLLLWLGSRGAFMFLHCVVQDRGEVAASWKKYRREGNSLLLFRLILAGCGLILILFSLALFIFFVLGGIGWLFTSGHPPKMSPGTVTAFVSGVGVFLLVWLVMLIVMIFTNQFVVPIMFLRRCTCTEAWGEFLGLLRDHPWNFVRYLLFQIVIALVLGLIVLTAILCTCCVAGILMLLPVLGAVLLLPITVFWRNYSLLYLSQFGPEYELLREEPPAIPQG